MNNFDNVILKFSLISNRKLQDQTRYHVAFTDFEVDIWKTGSWSIVGKSIYGKGPDALADRLDKLINPPKLVKGKMSPFLLRWIAAKGKYQVGIVQGCVVYRGTSDTAKNHTDMRVLDVLKGWSKRGLDWSLEWRGLSS